MSGAKITYAQSSDIKSRTYLEYRRDMKKKAIAELEFLPVLRRLLAERGGDAKLRVVKHGDDAELWFSPTISQAPDYMAISGGGKSFLYEFQYAEKADNLSHFDFKVSKVGRKKKGARIAHNDREFFYVVKPGARYAFVTPQWIMANGEVAAVPAWGSRPAYRVPREVFMPLLQDGGEEMAKVIQTIDDKNTLLEFQHDFLHAEAEKLSRLLQRGVDEKQLVTITPTTPEGFYQVCFLLDKLDKNPASPGVWMVYLLSMLGGVKTPMECARFVFALDFLYAKAGEAGGLLSNEQAALITALQQLQTAAQNYRWQGAPVNPQQSPMEETRQMLFVVNLLEDLRQDAAVRLGANVPKVVRIFETVPNPAQTAAFIRKAQKAAAAH